MRRKSSGWLASLLALAVAGGVAACGSQSQAESPAEESAVVITDAWVKATADTGQGANMTGAFMRLRNNTDSEVTLTSATTDVAGMVEIHETVPSEGSMVMRKKEGGLPVPPNGTVNLKPGGDHIMLMKLKRQLAPGDEVTLTLELSGAEPVTVTAPVKEFTGADETYHEHGKSSGN
ncbi:hypothetical protein FHU38_002442 [Saccharomonospora amisosensis]|uniref:Copper chaperone PCu(A)C n=1 Tax=Saccharomonospora amisosensis TaxID=1128677 RepID=A0A7X5ZQQ5_9PSEU|nr:copper chaperone PCu(A)C [Saccharomonospora amisosensis]NIJ12098.1 hypothetical protein [Saccharomonospora amisosensis]